MRAILYSWSSCSFCTQAKALLEARGVAFREVLLDGKQEDRRRLPELFGARTMPLVLLDGETLAGLEALRRALEAEEAPPEREA